ncbi:MAG: serine hydrolase [Kiritimatiellae bacterium]|nr:serine hydrolase [Kiritimatiellia bacterium]
MSENTYFPAPDTEGGWRTLSDRDEARRTAGIDPAKIDDVFEFIKGSTKNGGLLVVRHGWLVYERYFGKGHREATPNSGSCGKSFTSVAVGILMAERPDLFPEGLDQGIFTETYLPPQAFPLSDPRKAEIKLGQLLSFSAGIRGNNPCYEEGEERTVDPVGPDGWQAMVDEIALGKREGMYNDGRAFSAVSLWCEPGGGYSYATASIHIASIMLRHVTGMEMEAFIAEKLAKPLGWGRFGFGYHNTEAGAHTPGGGGMALRATDMLRFLYMLLHGGVWAGRQVVPADYVAQCGTVSPYNPHYPYSLQFTVNATGLAPELPNDAYWKAGSGGHALYVVPSLDLIVWKLGGRDEQFGESNTHLSEVPTNDNRDGWTRTVEDGPALRKTLEMVVGAIGR